ncbi:MAG: filamentous hemagglutinin N-terminal domain-containing protein [Nitrospira sp.]
MGRQPYLVRPMWLANVMSGMVALLCVSVSQGQTTSITSSGLNTQVAVGGIDQAGRQNYNITGGIRPGNGTNLFHSFGDFSVGTNNVARFLNDSGLATNNILSRVTGGHVSNIFGEINTANFPNANLYLINPAGVVFGATASLNVSGSVYVSTADYLRLADGLRFNATPGPQDAILSQAPVVAFGFLNPHPKPITVQGATLETRVVQAGPPGALHAVGTTLSLVGGDIRVSGSTLKAPSGQVQMVSVSSRGEVQPDSATSLQRAENGHITLTDSVIETNPQPSIGGRGIIIRGGQLVMDNSSIRSVGESSRGNGGSITVSVSDKVYAENSSIASGAVEGAGAVVSVISGQTIRLVNSTVESNGASPFGRPGSVELSAPTVSINASNVSASAIRSSPGGSGQEGTVTVQADRLRIENGSQVNVTADFRPGKVVLNATDTVTIDSSTIDVSLGRGGGGTGGNISIAAGHDVRLDNARLRADFIPNANSHSGGNGGNIVIDAGRTYVSQAGSMTTVSGDGNGGNIVVQAGEQLRADGTLMDVRALGATGNGGTISLQAGEQVHLQDNIAMASAGGAGTGGRIAYESTSVQLQNSRAVSTLETGIGGRVDIHTEGTASLIESSLDVTAGGKIGGVGHHAGSINIQAGNDIRLLSTRFTAANIGAGYGGNIGLYAGGNVLVDHSVLNAEARGGEWGGILIAAYGSARILNGSLLTVSNNGVGPGGELAIATGRTFVGQDSSFLARTGEGHGGFIRISAPESLRLANSFVDTSVGGSAASVGGRIQLASDTVRLENSQVKSNASHGTGGSVTIQTNHLQSNDLSVVEAVSFGGGTNGTVSIEPWP